MSCLAHPEVPDVTDEVPEPYIKVTALVVALTMVFLGAIKIYSPANKQQTTVYPLFEWSIPDGWPDLSIPDYFISISDNEVAQNPQWGKQIKVPAGQLGRQEIRQSESSSYDGLGLDPTKKYKVYIYGHYRKSEFDPDYISIPLSVPEFQIKLTGSAISFLNLLKALFLDTFDLLR